MCVYLYVCMYVHYEHAGAQGGLKEADSMEAEYRHL